jgi:hypothetical protein
MILWLRSPSICRSNSHHAADEGAARHEHLRPDRSHDLVLDYEVIDAIGQKAKNAACLRSGEMSSYGRTSWIKVQ